MKNYYKLIMASLFFGLLSISAYAADPDYSTDYNFHQNNDADTTLGFIETCKAYVKKVGAMARKIHDHCVTIPTNPSENMVVVPFVNQD